MMGSPLGWLEQGRAGSVGRAGNAAGSAWDYAMATACSRLQLSLDVKNLPRHLKANISTGCSQIMAN